MAETKKKERLNPFWRFFSSVRLTVALLIVVAFVSILGTLIPQGGREAFEFARGLNPKLFHLFDLLDLFDLYHSLWFRFLLACLALNIIICSVERFPKTWRRFSAVLKLDRNKLFEKIPPNQTFITDTYYSDVSRIIGSFLQGRYKKPRQKESNGANFFYGEKGRYSHFGVYLVHLSVLTILIGGLIGSFFGFEAYVNIPEGEAVKTITLRKSSKQVDLGFQVRCDEFFVDFYENGAPKEYRADLAFLVEGKEVERKSVRVNHPVRFMGVTFYQASYGTIPGKNARVEIFRNEDREISTKLNLETGKFMPLPGGEGKFRVAEARGDFMRMGPAVLVEVHPNQDEKVLFWIFKDFEKIKNRFPPGLLDRFPKLNPAAFEPYIFSLDHLESRYYTGLQANRDPGVSVVWVGFFLIVLGFFITFFTSHRRIWVRIYPDKGHTRLSVAGIANKNPVGLQRELERLTDDIKNLLDEKA